VFHAVSPGQVPLRLSSTCRDAILLQLDPASTTSALSVLVTFLTSASANEAALGLTKPNKLLLAIQQQVQQSGLLECLPQLYASTAEALRSAAVLRELNETAKPAAGDTCSSSSCATTAACSSCISTGVTDDGADHVSGGGSGATDTGSASLAAAVDSGGSSSSRDQSYSSSNNMDRPDSGDSGHNSIRHLEAYSEMLLPLYVQLSKLFPADVTGTAPGSSQQPVHDGAGSLAACSLAALQLVFAVVFHEAVLWDSPGQFGESYSSVLLKLADKAALALGALSGQLAACLRTDAALTPAFLSTEAGQLLLSPNHMLSLSYLTVLTALTAMYVEQSDILDTPFDFSEGSLPKILTDSGYSSSRGSAGSSNTSPHTSRRASTSLVLAGRGWRPQPARAQSAGLRRRTAS